MLPAVICAGVRRICMTAFATVVFPQPGLAGQADDLPGADRQVDAVDRAHAPLADAVVDRQAAELDERLALRTLCDGGRHLLDEARHAARRRKPRLTRSTRRRGLLTSSMPASTSVSPRTVTPIASPGNTNDHHSPWRTLELTVAQ